MPLGSLASDFDRSKPDTRTDRVIQGWKVSVDDRLLTGSKSELGTLALTYLEGDLGHIASALAPEKLEKLRSVRIVVDLTHGDLRPMQYHPSADWLRGHGYAEELARCVHIPRANDYTAPRHRHEQPWCVLHELAHAYHDQVLSFEEPRILAAWKQYKESGRGEKVLHIAGHRTRHYALTDQKEFFAEMTESYLGMNDFFPFNYAELKDAEPEICALLEETWGKLPR
jgi:hypothetical protein